MSHSSLQLQTFYPDFKCGHSEQLETLWFSDNMTSLVFISPTACDDVHMAGGTLDTLHTHFQQFQGVDKRYDCWADYENDLVVTTPNFKLFCSVFRPFQHKCHCIQTAGASGWCPCLFWYKNTWQLVFSWDLLVCLLPELQRLVASGSVCCLVYWLVGLCAFLTVKDLKICAS